MECLLPYVCIVTVPHIMVRLERMLDYRGVGLERFQCTYVVCTVPYMLLLRSRMYCTVHVTVEVSDVQ